LLSDDPLLGGTTDIDLVLYINSSPLWRANPGLTLRSPWIFCIKPRRISNRPASFVKMPDRLSLTFYHIILYDSDHWLEFIQSTVSAEFHRADHVLARVNPLLHSAREIWRTLNEQPPENTWIGLTFI
jgi:hypothetical protein